jgi:nicotinate-nucleotide adenylyltransferase
MTGLGRIGILGGTFDPFHLGHLAVAHAARRALGLDQVRIVPAATPPHRRQQPGASAHHRFAMAALAVVSEPDLVVDDVELESAGLSYTSSTLARLHGRGLAPTQIFFITGADAFAEIATWHDYPAVLDAAHFVVVARPGQSVLALREAMPELAGRMRDVAPDSRGTTVNLEAPAIFLVNTSTPGVSATEVRRAAASGRSLDGLVPPLVATHIVRHRLYETGSPSLSPAAGSTQAASPLHEQEPV